MCKQLCQICYCFFRGKVFRQHLVNLFAFTYFDLVAPFYFLKRNRYFSTLLLVLTSLTFFINYGGTYVLVHSFKDIR